jgi:hypothetical protein
VAVLAAAAGAYYWWAAPRPLSAEERALVGTWAVRLDGAAGDALEYEFRPDRTCRMRGRDPRTGAVSTDLAGLSWGLSGGRLVVRHPDGAAARSWHVLPSQRSADEVFRLTPDGPDRFRYTGTIEVRSTPTQPPVTGTMTRLPPAE